MKKNPKQKGCVCVCVCVCEGGGGGGGRGGDRRTPEHRYI